MRKYALSMAVLFLVLILAAGAVAQTHYYVNPVSGSDTNNGLDSGTAWQTVTHAMTAIDAANTTNNVLHLAAGTYKWTTDGGLETSYPIIVPSALVKLKIIGAGAGLTIFDPSGHQSWEVYYVFKATGLYSLEVSNLSITNGRGLLEVLNKTGGYTTDSLLVKNISGDNFDFAGTSFIPPIHIGNVKNRVILDNLNFANSRGEDSPGGGAILLETITGDVTVQNFTASSTQTQWYKGGAICANGVIGNLLIEDFTCTDTYSSGDGGAIYIGTVTGSLTIQNGTITDSYTENGSGGAIAIYDARSEVIIDNVNISGSRAFNDGGAISIDALYGDLLITDSQILNNNAVWGEGGGISVENLKADNLTITISDMIFDGNSTETSDGGALQIDSYKSDGNTLILDNLLVQNNSSGEWGDGGGIAISNIDFITLSNSSILNNYIDSSGDWYDGGGVFIENVIDLTVENVAFVGNVAQGSGGGLAVDNKSNVNETQTLTQVVFLDNVAEGDLWSGDGGGYYTTQAGEVTIDYALFAGNYATGDGGAMDFDRFNADSQLEISSITMAYNEAEGDGDAIYNEQTILDTFSIENSIIWANGDTSATAEIDPYSDAIEGATSTLEVSYSDVQTSDSVYVGASNLNTDPYFTDPVVNDYSVIAGSVVIDSGDPSTDPDSSVADTGIINIGYTPPSTTDPETGEITTVYVGSTTAPVSTGTSTGSSEAQKGVLRDKYIMIGPPVIPLVDPLQEVDYRDIYEAFGDDMNGTYPSQANQTWRFSRWENGTDVDPNYYGYVRYMELEGSTEEGDPDSLKSGLGYWFVYNDGIWVDPGGVRDTSFIDIGAKMLTTDEPYELLLDSKPSTSGPGIPVFGYNMMANPWPFYITWQDVRFSIDQTNWYDPTTAASSGWIDAYAIAWDHVNQTYNPKSGRIDPWEGFWVIVKTESPIWIQFNPNPVSSTLPTNVAAFAEALQQNLAWSTLISVRGVGNSLGDYNTWIGLGENLSDTYDTYDCQDPSPQTYETIYNRTRLTPSGSLSTALSRDFRADDISTNGDDFKAWLLTPIYMLSSDNPWDKTIENVQVRLQWPTIGTLPDSIQLSLWAAEYGDYDFAMNDEVLLIPDLAAKSDTIVTLDWTNFGSQYRFKYFWVVATLREGALSGKLTGIVEDNRALPTKSQIAAVYPNPFNPATTVRFDLANPSAVRISVFDLLGRRVATLVDGSWQAGYHHVTWNATGFSSGVYFVRMEMPGTGMQQVKRIVLQK